jgi:transposase
VEEETMARHVAGTTPLLTESLITDLSDVIRQGAYVETAAALCGISKDTFYRWLRQAEKVDAPDSILKLSYAIKKAMAEAELRDLTVIDGAAQNGQWQAAAWRLERKFPHRWGRQAKIQVEYSDSETKSTHGDDPRDEIKKLLGDPAAFDAMEILERKLNVS